MDAITLLLELLSVLHVFISHLTVFSLLLVTSSWNSTLWVDSSSGLIKWSLVRWPRKMLFEQKWEDFLKRKLRSGYHTINQCWIGYGHSNISVGLRREIGGVIIMTSEFEAYRNDFFSWLKIQVHTYEVVVHYVMILNPKFCQICSTAFG